MSLKTSNPLVCSCGRKGEIVLKENDQPFSGNWEKYSLINFEGESYSTTDSISFGEALKRMNATCPKCKGKITSQNIK